MSAVMNNIPVVFLPAGVDACALYRHYLPHLNIEKSMFLLRRGAIDIREVQHCKVAIVQRQVSEHNRAAILRLKEAGLKIIYDLDDNIWNLPSANPGKRQFDQMREGFEMCAREAHMLTVSTRGLATAAKTGFKLDRSEEHTSELQSRLHLVCRLLLEKKKKKNNLIHCSKTKKNQQKKQY